MVDLYARCECPRCKEKFTVDVTIEGFETMIFESEEQAKKYVLENVSLTVVYSDKNIHNIHNPSLIEVRN